MSARILIIEDDMASRELFGYLLGGAGYAASSVPDGAQGLRAAAAEAPDLIVCDLQMPTMSGFEFLAALRADPALRATPVVAVTAFSMPGDRERVAGAGFDGYLTKPVDPATFVASIAAYLPAHLRGGGAAVGAPGGPGGPP